MHQKRRIRNSPTFTIFDNNMQPTIVKRYVIIYNMSTTLQGFTPFKGTENA